MFRQMCLHTECGVSLHSSMSTQDAELECSLKPAAQKHLCTDGRNREEFGADRVQSARRLSSFFYSDRRQSSEETGSTALCAPQLTRPFGVLTHWWAHCGAEGLEQLLRAHPAPSSDLSAQLVKPLHTRRGSTHSPLPH